MLHGLKPSQIVFAFFVIFIMMPIEINERSPFMLTAKTGNCCTTPSCTIYDCPFTVGHPVWVTGFVGSLVCKAAGVVTAPYATTAAVFFGVLGAVSCYGQYRSRQNYLAEEKLVTNITDQNTEMKGNLRDVSAKTSALTAVDQTWKEKAEQLEKDKSVLGQAKESLQKLVDILRQQNAQLTANASSAAKGAQEDDAEVRQLHVETSSLGSELTQGVASQAKLDADVRGISGGLADVKEQTGMLQQGIAQVTSLVNALRRPSAGGIRAGQDALATAGSLEALTKSAQQQADGLV